MQEDRIPTEVVAPVLERKISDWWGKAPQNEGETAGLWILGELLSEQFGLTCDSWYRRLKKIVACRQETCSLSVVDHILVAIGCEDVWYEEPLRSYYFRAAA